MQALVQAWNGRSGDTPNRLGQLLVTVLLPVSWLFAGAVAIRRELYRRGFYKQKTLPVPVIVVGNVMVGGVGKTPITMALVNHLKAQGLRVGVLSRGYGRKTSSTLAVSPKSQSLNVGDEPLLIARSCQVPVFVGNSRVDAGLALLSLHRDVQVLVCDDGLQHGPLARDLELCVFDERGVGNGWLLPAGPLREPWPRPVDLLLHTGTPALAGGFQGQRQLAAWAVRADGERVALSSLQGQAVDAVAGLARPEAFFEMLRAAGLSLDHTHALPDHADFADWPDTPLVRPLLCTEKDAAKLWQRQPEALAVPLLLDIETPFWTALDALLAERAGTPVSSAHGQQTA